MKCLDTYALIEIRSGNKDFVKYIHEEFIITDLTLVEFYWVLLREVDEQTAELWLEKLKHYGAQISLNLMIKAMKLRKQHKSKNLSFFDCVGYIFSLENKIPFVTGDKEFEHLPNVEFMK